MRERPVCLHSWEDGVRHYCDRADFHSGIHTCPCGAGIQA